MSNTTEQSRTYSIQEAAIMTGLPESTLRYYEGIEVSAPVARDASSHHRRYTDVDIDAAIFRRLLQRNWRVDRRHAYLPQQPKVGADSADEQIELLQRQQQRLADESTFLPLRRQYLDVKVDYWRAMRTGDQAQILLLTDRAHGIAAQLQSARGRSNKQEAA